MSEPERLVTEDIDCSNPFDGHLVVRATYDPSAEPEWSKQWNRDMETFDRTGVWPDHQGGGTDA